tara:strand:+ start:534 stop:1589 length:1056 start_codon:yes stop_codon:yes gene_type:complete
MKVLFVGDLRLESGGPKSVMSTLKEKFDQTEKIKLLLRDTRSKTNIKYDLSDVDVIHFHEIWNFRIIKLISLAEKNGIPYLFTFHGVLNSWSLKRHKFLKLIFLTFFKKKLFLNASAFHFLNKNEYNEASLLGFDLKNKSFILPNGIEIMNDKEEDNPRVKRGLKLIYIGRFHPKKGLINLIDTFKIVKKNQNSIYLDIIGPDSNYKKILKREILNNSLQNYITLKEPIYEFEKKRNEIIQSDFFILPSFDEADSMAIKESLSAGTPVIITKECKFYDVEENKIGFHINHNSKEIYEILMKIMKIKNIKEEYKKSCINFSKENFEINKLANKYFENLSEMAAGVKYSDNWQ